MKRNISAISAFAVGILSIFAFKAPEAKGTKDQQTRWTYNSSDHIPANCVSALCTNTNTHKNCGISGGVFQDNQCQTTESVYTFKN